MYPGTGCARRSSRHLAANCAPQRGSALLSAVSVPVYPVGHGLKWLGHNSLVACLLRGRVPWQRKAPIARNNRDPMRYRLPPACCADRWHAHRRPISIVATEMGTEAGQGSKYTHPVHGNAARVGRQPDRATNTDKTLTTVSVGTSYKGPACISPMERHIVSKSYE